MTKLRFDGLVKPMRRGDWSARGAIVADHHGILTETQVGPREFAARDLGIAWLRHAAAELSIEVVQIEVRTEHR